MMRRFLMGALLLTWLCVAAHAANIVLDMNTDQSTRLCYLSEKATAAMKVINNENFAANIRLDYEITDFYGNTIEQSSKTLTLAAQSSAHVQLDFKPGKPGYFAWDIDLIYSSVNHGNRQWSTAVYEYAQINSDDSPMMTYTIGNTAMLDHLMPLKFYENMAQSGARWGTMDYWWSLVETSQDNYNWAYYDRFFENMLRSGITPIPHLFGTPQWNSSNPGVDNYWAYAPVDYDELDEFVFDFVTRYKDWIQYLRIWNEPNVGYWQGDYDEFADLVKVVSDAAKRAKPDIKIIVEAVEDTYNSSIEFLDEMHARGVTPYYDVVAIHNYWSNSYDALETTTFQSAYEDLIDWRDTNKPGAPVWDTEFGIFAEDWSTGFWKGVGETNQARWIARAFLLGFPLGLEKMCYFPGYSWPDPAPYGTTPYYNPAGMLRVDLSARPALVAYHTVSLAMDGADYERDLSVGTDRYGRVFRKDGDFVTALWSVDSGHAGSVNLYLDPAEDNVQLVNLMGERSFVTPTAAGRVSLNLDENVLFLYSESRPKMTTYTLHTVSGGGSNVLQSAISGASAYDIIEITDSSTYTETGLYNGLKEGLKIRAAAGQTPSINFTSLSAGHGWTPNVPYVQIGDNNGGQITFRRQASGTSYALSGQWLAGGLMRVENCKFTGAGSGGPWYGKAIWTDGSGTIDVDRCNFLDLYDSSEPVIWASPWNDGATINLSRSHFSQTSQATNLEALSTYLSGRHVTFNVNDSTFNNHRIMTTLDEGDFIFRNCLFSNPGDYGIQVYNNDAKVTVSHSAFHNVASGNIFIWVASTGNPVVKVDHCDFDGGTGLRNGPAVQVGNSTNAIVSVTNSNIGVSPHLSNSGVGGSFGGTYDYNNFYNSSKNVTGDGSIWFGGPNNLGTAQVPGYASLPTNWTSSNANLATASSSGGVLGSSLNTRTHRITGGGIDRVKRAIEQAQSGDTILIADSAVYTETYTNYAMKANIRIVAEQDQNPVIQFTGNGDGWKPNVGGVQIGSSEGGKITFRQKTQWTAPINSVNMGNTTMTLENCRFTGVGPDGPWEGQALLIDGAGQVTVNDCEFVDLPDTLNPYFAIDMSLTAGGSTLNLNDCRFKQSNPASNLVALFQYKGNLSANLNVTNSYFKNHKIFIDYDRGTLNVQDSVFDDPTQYGIQIYNHAMTATISNSAFWNVGSGEIGVWIATQVASSVMIDHCDFDGESGKRAGAAVQVGNSTKASVTVTESNIGTSLHLHSSGVGAGFSGSYSYNNFFNSTKNVTSDGVVWINGGNNLPSGIVPGYANPPLDWMYADPTLSVADSLGEPLGSLIGWGHRVSGGGTNVIARAIREADEGESIVITDSAVYHETNWNDALKTGISIRAELGETPEINFGGGETGWQPNGDGVKIGSNSGGQITLRQSVPDKWVLSSGALWGQTLRIENCRFTGVGAGGPWEGQALYIDGPGKVYVDNCEFIDLADIAGHSAIVMSYWRSGAELELTNSHFEQTTTTVHLDAFTQGPTIGGYSGNAIIDHCSFTNFRRFVNFDSGTLGVGNSYFRHPTQFGFHIYNHAPIVLIENSTFYNNDYGDIVIWVPDTGNPNITIDHCDFAGDGSHDWGPAVQLGNGTNATVDVTNTNIGLKLHLHHSGVGGSSSASYSYSNLFAHTKNVTGDGSVWANGGSNVSPAITPDYASLPDDWTYTNGTLATAGSGGTAIGSFLDWLN